MLFDHLDARAAVFGHLIDVSALHEAHADISMPQAVSCSRFAVPVEFQLRPVEKVIEQLDVIAGENQVGRLSAIPERVAAAAFAAFLVAALPLAARLAPDRFGTGKNTPVNAHRTGHALAMANAAFAAHLDFKDFLSCTVIFRDGHIAVFKIERFIGAQAGVRHEKHKVVHLFSVPFIVIVERFLCVSARGFVERFIFLRTEPRAMHNLALRFIRRGQVRQMLKPAVPDGGLEHHAQGYDLIMKGATGRRLLPELVQAFGFGIWLVVGCHPVDAVFLHLARSDLVKGKAAKKRHQVETQPNGVALRPLLAAFAFRDDGVFLKKLSGSFLEGRPCFQNSGPVLAMQVRYQSSATLLAPDPAFLV